MYLVEQFLIIDDEEITTFVSRTVIHQTFPGTNVVSFTNPIEAVEYLKTTFTESPVSTLVLLDINMSLLDGWQVVEILKDYDAIVKEKLSILLYSSYIDNTVRRRANENPMVLGCLEKPLNKVKLQEVMELLKLAMW